MNQSFFHKLLYGGGVFFDLTKWIIFIIVILVLVNSFWITVFIVDGESMEPNLHNREIVLLKKNGMAGTFDPQRGDVVVTQYPGDPENKRYVKRTIGLPGETVKIADGKVYVNGQLLKERYLAYNLITEPSGTWTMGPNEYFLCGDNRPNSNDSRYFGAVEKRFITGRALIIMFPRMRFIASNEY